VSVKCSEPVAPAASVVLPLPTVTGLLCLCLLEEAVARSAGIVAVLVIVHGLASALEQLTVAGTVSEAPLTVSVEPLVVSVVLAPVLLVVLHSQRFTVWSLYARAVVYF